MSTENLLKNFQQDLANEATQIKQNTSYENHSFERNQNYTEKWNDNYCGNEQEAGYSLSEELRYMLEEIIIMKEKGSKLIKNIDQISQNLTQLHQQITKKTTGAKSCETSLKKANDLKPKRPHSCEGRRPVKGVEDIRNENQLLMQILNETDVLLSSGASGEREYPECYLQKLMEYLQLGKNCNLLEHRKKIEKLKETVLILMSQKGCMPSMF